MWERINDKVNNGVQRALPDPEFTPWLRFRKTEKSNKILKEDLRKSCQEFEAAFCKGNHWLKSPNWASVLNKFKNMANAVYKLQVISCLATIHFLSVSYFYL
jgi:hypothetical protein